MQAPNYAAGDLVWRATSPDPGAKQALAGLMRKKALAKLVIGGVAATLIYLWWSRTLAYVVAGLTLTTFTLALVSPTRAYAALEAALQRFADWVGLLVTYLLLVPVYILFFTPLGLLRKSFGRDRLKRAWNRDAATYWEEHEPGTGYDRQF